MKQRFLILPSKYITQRNKPFSYITQSIKHTIQIYLSMTPVHQSTLFNIIERIKITPVKLSRTLTTDTDIETASPVLTYKKNWSKAEERMLFNIIAEFGSDYTLLKHHFPSKTRRQIKKKCIQIQEAKLRQLEYLQRKKTQEKRKDSFDRQVMDLQMIESDNIKHNKPENVNDF